MRASKHWLVPVVITLIVYAISDRRPAMAAPEGGNVSVGFGEADITPKIEPGKPVYIAGYGQNRKATGVNDPLLARTVVLQEGKKKVALVSIDVVGWFHPYVEETRQQLPDYHYVLVSSTHNHEGPDTIGLWGPSPFKSGVDPEYIRFVKQQIVESVKRAEKALQPATARIGTAVDPELLSDKREPYVKHDELVAVQFSHAQTAKPLGVLVQWNCHPETLGDRNTLVSADYVGYTVNYLQKKYGCPVAYFTGTVGGLMTTLGLNVKDESGKALPKDSYEMTERYGVLLGQLADKALAAAKPLRLTPIDVRSKIVFLPMQNAGYQTAQWLGVFDRQPFLWTGDPSKGEPAKPSDKGKPLALRSEVALLKLGELETVAIPGEIYPELVLGKVQNPADPGADFPDAELEPALYQQLKGPYRMIIGLANDEIGYIIPKRQWDAKAPFCYGRKRSQYGEINSIGSEAAPILCRAVKELAEGR